MSAENLPIIVGISGASGAPYAAALLSALRRLGVTSHLIVSRAAEITLTQETDLTLSDLYTLADHVHEPEDIAAPPSSGSFRTRGMIVAPCSVRTMSEIATGVTASLLTRAADVTLKERRPLLLMVRETPLHSGHLRTMLALSEMGAIIAPPVPAFYARPATVADIVEASVGRALDLFGLDSGRVHRWDGISPD
ncbi:MAG: UbiX family flavin prenyltransferase [Rhodospirillaceae bacterium]|nr:UbiX family flavin prenyltransferase [Rhodospirillaceae bacterium]